MRIIPTIIVTILLLSALNCFAGEATLRKEVVPPVPATKVLLQSRMRDPSVCMGSDGCYYLTGTTGKTDVWFKNEGIEVWRSKDLTVWESLGMVWSIEKDGTWQKRWTPKKIGDKEIMRRVVWAPEIHYIKGTYWIPYSMPGLGIGILKSTTGRPEGPYANALANDEPVLPGRIDASLFEDDDGKVYLVYGAGFIVEMAKDMSALAGEPRQMRPVPPDLDPLHHSKSHCMGDAYNHIGFEGAFVFKADKRYYFACAENYNGRYTCMMAQADSLYGPYGPRYEAFPWAGHVSCFKDAGGAWWSTFFDSRAKSENRERPAIFRISFAPNGEASPAETVPASAP